MSRLRVVPEDEPKHYDYFRKKVLKFQNERANSVVSRKLLANSVEAERNHNSSPLFTA